MKELEWGTGRIAWVSCSVTVLTKWVGFDGTHFRYPTDDLLLISLLFLRHHSYLCNLNFNCFKNGRIE